MAESKKVTGNDVIQKDFLSNAIANAEKFLDVIVKTEDAIVALNKEQTKQLANAKKGESAADIKKQNELLDKAAKSRKLIAEAKKLEAEATIAATKAKAAEESQEKKTNAEKAKTAKALQQENSLYFQQSKRLNELRKEYKELALAGKGSDKATQDLKKSIQALDKELKDLDAEVGQFNRNVGDYKNQVAEALEGTDLFSAGLGKLDNNTKAIVAGFGGVVEQLKKVRQAQDVATDGSNKLGKSLKAAGITVLIAAIASLFSFFTSSREGALQFDLALNKLKATLDVLIGSFAQVGKGLVSLGDAFVSFFSGDFSKAADQASEGTKTIKNAFDGNASAIVEQIKGYDELTKAIFAYEDQLRLLQIALAKVKMDEEDFNEIQADNTISLNEQKAALEGAIQARLEGARISAKIADTDLILAGKQLELELRKNKVSEQDIELLRQQGFETISNSKLSVKASTEAINAVQEKYLAQLAAADALDDLDRQEAERRRQIAQTEIINQVELIRSKKLGADAQVQILTKQVADEKIQLEERERINEELRSKQIEAQNEEIRILAELKTSKGEQAISEAELNDLIATTDAVVLAGKLKILRATRLSEEATTEVAKVVNEAQTNEIANNDRIAKFEDEKIERLAKIARINQEIAIIEQNTQLQALNEAGSKRASQEQETLNLLFRNENVFNNKIISEAQRLSDERIAIAEEEARIKKELIDKQYQIDKENIEKNVTDEQVKAKELEKLQAQYNQNVIKLNTDRANSTEELNKQIAETQRQILVKQTEVVVDYINKASGAFSDALDQRFQQQSNAQQASIDKTNANIAKQQDLAARGQENQLAFEEKRLAEQQLAQQDAAKRQAKIQDQIQTAQALLNAYNSELNQPGANPASAGARAIADVLLFKGLAKGIVQFAADGNDDVQGPGTTKSDSIPFMLSKHEGVVKADANLENKGVVKALNAGTFKQLYTPKIPNIDTGSTAHNIANSIMLQNASKIESLLEDISNKPSSNLSADALGNIVETIISKKGKKTITHKRGRI
jgi:hypothetical protein